MAQMLRVSAVPGGFVGGAVVVGAGDSGDLAVGVAVEFHAEEVPGRDRPIARAHARLMADRRPAFD